MTLDLTSPDRMAKTVGLTINAPEIFEREDFLAWLNKADNRILSYHPKGSLPDEYSDTVVLVDANYEGDCSDMPADIWISICNAVYSVYGGPERPRSLKSHFHVRLTNLAS